VSTIQQIFSPTEAEIAQAQAIITAYQAHLVTGEGVFVWNGRMVDKPIVRAAEQVLARARSAHLLDE
jgi:citrate lyase beta subunit